MQSGGQSRGAVSLSSGRLPRYTVVRVLYNEKESGWPF